MNKIVIWDLISNCLFQVSAFVKLLQISRHNNIILQFCFQHPLSLYNVTLNLSKICYPLGPRPGTRFKLFSFQTLHNFFRVTSYKIFSRPNIVHKTVQYIIIHVVQGAPKHGHNIFVCVLYTCLSKGTQRTRTDRKSKVGVEATMWWPNL